MSLPLRPMLTVDTLRDAYEAMRGADSVEGSPLLSFVLVRQKLLQPNSLRGEAAEKAAVFDLLTEIVFRSLKNLREIYQLSPPKGVLSRNEAINELNKDGKTGNDLLVGCSAIYYRYVRSDLGFSLGDIYTYLHHDERTMRRRMQVAWQHLVQIFIQLETDARATARKQRCLLALPRQNILQLATQKTLVQTVTQQVPENVQSILIHGVPGIGKTTLALKISEAVVQSPLIGEAAWINQPTLTSVQSRSGEALASLICETLHLARDFAKLTAVQIIEGYLQVLLEQQQRLLVILDGAEQWEFAIQQAQTWLSHCVVIVTSRLLLDTWLDWQIRCLPLDEEDSFQLIEFLTQNSPKQIQLEAVYPIIWNVTKGNPGAIKRAYLLLDFLPPASTLSRVSLLEHYETAWQQLSTITQHVWLLLDLLSVESPITYQDFLPVTESILKISTNPVSEALVSLAQLGFIDVQILEQHYIYNIPTEVREIIAKINTIQLDTFIEKIVEQKAGHLAFACLQAYTPPASLLIPPAHQYVVITGQWERWFSILELLISTPKIILKDQLSFQIEAAVALRWLGRFDDAIQRIEAIIIEARQTTEMAILGKAYLEKSSILYYLDDLLASLEAAQTALQIFDNVLFYPEFLEQSKVAIVRALSQVDPQQAQTWLAKIEWRSNIVWDLITQIELSLKNRQEALEAAKSSLDLQSDASPGYARSLGRLAQALVLNNDMPEAIKRFEQSINVLQRRQDIVALARMHNNFGVALMQANKWDMAQEHFLRSLNLHEKLQDPYGRMIAEENLSLNQQLWRDKYQN